MAGSKATIAQTDMTKSKVLHDAVQLAVERILDAYSQGHPSLHEAIFPHCNVT